MRGPIFTMINKVYTLHLGRYNPEDILKWAIDNNMEDGSYLYDLPNTKQLFTSYRKFVRTRFIYSSGLPFKFNHILLSPPIQNIGSFPFIQMFSIDKVLLFKLTYDKVLIITENLYIKN
jgi:hypothetical protein